jgi:hypothetical protein
VIPFAWKSCSSNSTPSSANRSPASTISASSHTWFPAHCPCRRKPRPWTCWISSAATRPAGPPLSAAGP